MLLGNLTHQGFECVDFRAQSMVMRGRYILMSACEQWSRFIGRALVALAKCAEHAQGGVDVLVGAQGKRIKANAFHIEQLVNQHITNGAQFVCEFETVAQ